MPPLDPPLLLELLEPLLLDELLLEPPLLLDELLLDELLLLEPPGMPSGLSPFGVPPPQACRPIVATTTRTSHRGCRDCAMKCRRVRANGTRMPASRMPPGINGFTEDPRPFNAVIAGVVVILSVEVAALPLTRTPAGEKLQAAPSGSPEHAKFTF